jgi:hypothetical protein
MTIGTAMVASTNVRATMGSPSTTLPTVRFNASSVGNTASQFRTSPLQGLLSPRTQE